eukprot:CAMPEP_0170275790 /NCGR_PEP_ID=MMETSP0116_2-20130129/37877_1 /TAXON_ID=400756 /ORGANISM="Durinskia baltica, Strain CSIRO CS-38" /LENGTH=141 /DNA_ID=CAMNT_0010527057 /DNA_START=61 /DNA_END=483 /DNA_ORIENTATION=-
MSAAAAVPAEPTFAAATAPGIVYSAAPQQVQYVTAPQPVTYMASQPAPRYMVAGGQTMVMGESQMVGGSSAVPVQYEYTGAPAPVTYAAAPAVFSISPERFAQIAAGIPLTQEEIAAMTSGTAPPAPAAAPLAAPAEPTAA